MTTTGTHKRRDGSNDTLPGILYLCPDIRLQSAGIRRIYRHVQILAQAGLNAHILHLKSGFRREDLPPVPLLHLDGYIFKPEDILVIPEGMPALMHAVKDHPCRRFVIALNWDYIFKNLPPGMNWREFNIERVLTVSPVVGGMVSWSMDLPVHVLASAVDRRKYYVDKDAKMPRIVYINRKAPRIDPLRRLLGARNPEFIQKIEWIGLDGLPEKEYAAQIRQAAIFLNLSEAEGYPTSCLEAMASGTLVAGYDAVGGRMLLHGDGPQQNCVLAPIGDYLSLAYALTPVLEALLNGRWQRYAPILDKALESIAELTPSKEADALISFWSERCAN